MGKFLLAEFTVPFPASRCSVISSSVSPDEGRRYDNLLVAEDHLFLEILLIVLNLGRVV